MRLLFIGDIVGTPGVGIARKAVPLLRSRHGLDVIIANAENASAGAGLYSLWRTPVPALMRCTSPGRMTEPLPRLSLCSRDPARM